MPWLLRQKMGKEAAVCSYVRLIREAFPLIERTAPTKQPVLMEKKIFPICRWPGMA